MGKKNNQKKKQSAAQQAASSNDPDIIKVSKESSLTFIAIQDNNLHWLIVG